MTRFIYWRAQFDDGLRPFAGRFKDLKTLKGATARIWRRFRTATTVEASFVPFPENFSPPNYQHRPDGVTLVEGRPV